MTDAFFIILSIVSVVSAILVVSPRNPIYGALSLLVMMLSLAGIFLQLTAPFLAVMQLVVYAGAVIVLFIFVIMMMNLEPAEMGEEKGFWYKMICFFLAGFLAVFMTVGIAKSRKALPDRFPEKATAEKVETKERTRLGRVDLVDTETGSVPETFGSTPRVGEILFNPYVVPFELVSVLIVIAVVGAVVLTKRKV